jgi:hypothetical protein
MKIAPNPDVLLDGELVLEQGEGVVSFLALGVFEEVDDLASDTGNAIGKHAADEDLVDAGKQPSDLNRRFSEAGLARS